MTSDQARQAIAPVMTLPRPPTAVLALNLGISEGVLLDHLIQRRRYAFVATDENSLSAGLGVSAIVRDPQELGRRAALLAVDRLADPVGPPCAVSVPSRLLRRGSGEIPVDLATA